jgi:hypothetical protein
MSSAIRQLMRTLIPLSGDLPCSGQIRRLGRLGITIGMELSVSAPEGMIWIILCHSFL